MDTRQRSPVAKPISVTMPVIELTTISSTATSIVQFQTLPGSKPFLIRVSDEAFVE
jgi:hypothetical protein